MNAPLSPNPLSLQTPGHFIIGCNYWASHAGTEMWRNWRPDVIDADFARLAAHGLQVLRLFPIWPDFQPIVQLRGQSGVPVEIRLGEQPLPTDPIGQAGVAVEMLERLVVVCKLAESNGLKLIIGLVTGWMSGRLFVPPALEGRDPLTDATSLAWQIKMVGAIVRHTRDQPAILTWDLGNECNCMGNAGTRDAAYLWTASITHAIRAADATRPVVSGMHALAAATTGMSIEWIIDDQGELTDILTTHPYPYWTRHTRNDAVTEFRTTFHATAETRFYGDIGGKPCFAEEIGTMGPMVAGDQVSASFARINLFSLWANDCRGFLWWCSHDQTELVSAPYDWNGVELELGLVRMDGTAKPVLEEMRDFRKFLRDLPFTALPRRETEAVCIFTHNQDDWAVAFGAFVLAKQAKLEIEYRHIQQEIPFSSIYLLPSIKGANCIPRRQWHLLLDRVRAGATLYLSLADGIVPHFNEVAGVELFSRGKPSAPMFAAFLDDPVSSFSMPGGDDLCLEARSAKVLARRLDNQQPVFWRNKLGEGWVYVFAAPIESELSVRPGSFDAGAPAYWKIYRALAGSQKTRRWLSITSPEMAVTEHRLDDDRRVVIVINHNATAKAAEGQLIPGVALGATWRGAVRATAPDSLALRLAPGHAAVFELMKPDL